MLEDRITLNPQQVEESAQALVERCGLDPDALDVLGAIIALFPCAATVYYDAQAAAEYHDLHLVDKFTFDMEQDALILLGCDRATLIDALIEMAMYLVGFSTQMGIQDTWAVEFTIGAWKVVKKNIKRGLGLETPDKPQAVIGLPPADRAQVEAGRDPYPFRTLVRRFDQASFYQMVVLAARDDVAVYFPPETHHKVLAVYVYMRRAIEEVGTGLDLDDHAAFNTRLIDEIQRMQALFRPDTLAPPAEQASDDALPPGRASRSLDDEANRLGVFPSAAHRPQTEDADTMADSSFDGSPLGDSPFADFIEHLFDEDDDNGA